MTKAENRAAAKAWREDRDRERREESRAKHISADLEALNKLRNYLIFDSRTGVPGRPLIDAIDDHVGRLTGDRTTLHAKSSSFGPTR